MKSSNLILSGLVVIVIAAACGSSRKTTGSTVAPAPTPVVSAPVTPPLLFVKPANGIYAPGEEELAAMHIKDSSVTLDQLKEGYTIYAQGTCIHCHEAQNIYRYTETQWKVIVDNMAIKASMPLAQKVAVYNYVLAIKATQPKEETR